MKALREHGINVCLGTDSLASNTTLDMRAEMREAQNLHGLGDRDVLEMVLLNGARALGQTGILGQISPGATADLVAFPQAASGAGAGDIDPYHHVVQSREEPNLLLINGRPSKLDLQMAGVSAGGSPFPKIHTTVRGS
jgi:5-methylthioadenosine/S-adenosylhomocysteine deaminase